MLSNKNMLLDGQHGKPVVTDILYSEASTRPLIIYAHGINGFKDWGNFDLIAKQFVKSGFVFVKFNFSHNGTTPEQPEDFADLDAYGNDNYTIQLDDLKTVIDWICDETNTYAEAIDTDRIYLLGHSKGGTMVLLKAAEDIRIKAVASWASPNACKTPWGNWDDEKMEQWEHTGVQYLTNGRTKQEMPLYYQLYQNYKEHEHRFNLEEAVKSIKIPLLICHGTEDPAVPVTHAKDIHHWKPDAELFTLPTDHVFGRKHPWTEEHLPEHTQQLVDKTISFFKKAADE